MNNYEVKATITIVGWDNVPAVSEEAAIAFVKDRIDRFFDFHAPLVNKYSEISVEIDKGIEND